MTFYVNQSLFVQLEQVLFACLSFFFKSNLIGYQTPENSGRAVSGRWAGRAIAHTDFVKLEGPAKQRRRHAALFLAHPVFVSYLRPFQEY